MSPLNDCGCRRGKTVPSGLILRETISHLIKHIRYVRQTHSFILLLQYILIVLAGLPDQFNYII